MRSCLTAGGLLPAHASSGLSASASGAVEDAKDKATYVEVVVVPRGVPAELEQIKRSLFGSATVAAQASAPRVQHLLAIERASPGPDGGVYTMRARDISSLCGDIAPLFEHAHQLGIRSSGIGDGGNELGMGKLRDRVIEHIPNGDRIVSAFASDNIITAGVSDWGGIALACALAIKQAAAAAGGVDTLVKSNGGSSAMLRNVASTVAPSVEWQRCVLEAAVKAGAADGISGKQQMTVDGLEFDTVHTRMIQALLAVVDSFCHAQSSNADNSTQLQGAGSA